MFDYLQKLEGGESIEQSAREVGDLVPVENTEINIFQIISKIFSLLFKIQQLRFYGEGKVLDVLNHLRNKS